VPGYLSFRELPLILAACRKVSITPDLILVDGQGIAHPRGFGLASHLGLFLNFPTMGIAKNKLFGVETEEKKVYFDLEITFISHPQTGEKIGAAVRRVLKSRRRLKPIYISPGHLVDLKSAIELYIRISGRHRLPKVMRAADRISKTSS
jgi:deoxyribonuclease V